MFKKFLSMLGNNIIISTLIKLKQVLPTSYQKKSLKMMVLLFLNSLLEMVGLAAFLPLFSVILQPGMINSHHIIKPIYDTLGFTSENAFILALAGLIVIAILIKNSVALLIVKSQARFSLSLYQYFANRLHQLYYSKGFPFFKKTNSNVIVRNINVIPNQFSNGIVMPMFNLLNEIAVLLLILLGLLLYDAKAIFLLVFTVLPVFLLFYNWVKDRALKVEKEVNAITPLLGSSIFQSIHGYADVEITNTQEHFRKKISDYIGRVVKLSIRRVVFNAAPTRVIETGMVITIFVITVYGIYFMPDRAGLMALLGLFALAAYRILPSVNRIMLALISIKGNQYTFDVIDEVKGFTPEKIIKEDIGFAKSVVISDLSFRFPDSDINTLNHINLEIFKGESLGFIGVSGSGKTTLMNLLLGFWKPTTGQIAVDGHVLNEQTLSSWRDRIGYVQQEVYIIDASVAENVAFGISKADIDHAKLERVLKQASLWDFVQSLPDNIDTNIGERGTRLSGGQRQRVGIARALYSGADILFFDEATSALDTQTENDITESIRSLADGNLTLIIIAHRKTTLKYCSRIIEIQKGDIKGMFKYEEI